jgi:beta-hydroxyacyl-ACP dehydratase FabZ
MSSMDHEAILRILPHRYPMLMVDRVIECDLPNQRIVGIKNVAANEPYFQGHFPGNPVMPGVLQLEAMAQTGGILMKQLAADPGGTTFFLTVDKAKFRKVVRPGDQLRIEANIVNLRARSAKFQGRILVDGAITCEAEMMCMLVHEGQKG